MGTGSLSSRTVRTGAGQEQALHYRWGKVVRFKAESEGLSGGWYKLREENKHGSDKCNKNEDIC